MLVELGLAFETSQWQVSGRARSGVAECVWRCGVTDVCTMRLKDFTS